MAKDWEKLAGEKGEEVPKGRLQRLLTLGKMGAKVGVSTLTSKAASLLSLEDEQHARLRQQKSFELNAERVVQALGQLKGASMKVGQMLSADPELVPEGFGDMLSSLQNSAPPMTYATIKAQVERAYDRPIQAVFRFFDPDPIGAASIGQVHRATLDDGQQVAVKIQYPGVVEALESDLKSLGHMLVYGRAMVDKGRLDEYLEEIRAAILKEADYVAEANNMLRFQEILRSWPGVRVPTPYLEHTYTNILVMEYVEGLKLDDALATMPKPQAHDLLAKWVMTYSWMFHERFEMHADPHPGNFLLEEDGTMVILDFGSVKTFDPEFADGILDILDTCWHDEPERAIEIYRRMGFAKEGFDFGKIDPDLLAQYHQIVLEPFLKNAPFAFNRWSPALEGKKFMLKHPEFLKLVPPAEAIPYFRMLSGVKGLLIRFDAEVNVCQMALEIAARRGRLTKEPIFL